MSGNRINPFIANQTSYNVQKKEDKKVSEQPQSQEVVDVKAKPAVSEQPQVTAKADSELVSEYFGFSKTRGVALDPEIAAVLSEVIPEKHLAGVKRYNAIANETRIKASQEKFDETAPEVRVDDPEFAALFANINPKYHTPEQRMSIALATEDFEALV